MQNKFSPLVILLAISFAANAQTKRIAHRSHGGTNTERYDGIDGNYGLPSHPPPPPMVKVHMESGRDTFVSLYDSLARPIYMDSLQQRQNRKLKMQQLKPMKKISQVGNVTGKLLI